MARQPRTPGATTEAPKPEPAQTPVPAQDDATLDAILGTPDAKDAEPTATNEASSSPDEPVQAEPTNAELLEIINGLKSQIANQAAAPVAQHVPSSSVGGEPVAKRKRQVLTDDGWTSEEY